MPFVLPWENCPSLQTQTGMGAFGTQRDPKIQIEQGHIELVQVRNQFFGCNFIQCKEIMWKFYKKGN